MKLPHNQSRNIILEVIQVFGKSYFPKTMLTTISYITVLQIFLRLNNEKLYLLISERREKFTEGGKWILLVQEWLQMALMV